MIQSGNLRVTVLAQVEPPKLPRKTPAPIAVFISGHVGTVNGAVPPQLQTMTVKVNRHGLLQSKGLPVCHLPEIQPASTERALDDCSDALVGSGRFWASVVFPDQRPYPTRGRLLVFNGRVGKKPVLFAHIFTTQPFASSFVVTFALKSIHQGPYRGKSTAGPTHPNWNSPPHRPTGVSRDGFRSAPSASPGRRSAPIPAPARSR